MSKPQTCHVRIRIAHTHTLNYLRFVFVVVKPIVDWNQPNDSEIQTPTMTGLYTASEWLEHSVACIREKYVPDNRCWTFDTENQIISGKVYTERNTWVAKYFKLNGDVSSMVGYVGYSLIMADSKS